MNKFPQSSEEEGKIKKYDSGIEWRRLFKNKIIWVVKVDEEKLIDKMDLETLERVFGESVF